jgi:tRNA-modifying protein YgfZ
MTLTSPTNSDFKHAVLPSRGVIQLSGADRVKFLQGLVSNNVALAAEGIAVYAALLTPQGKFLHEMLITDWAESLWLDCEAAGAATLIARLLKYKLRSDVTLVDRSLDLTIAAALDREDLAESQGLPPSFRDPRHLALGWRAIVPRQEPAASDRENFKLWDRHRIRLNIADGSRDLIAGETILLEANFDRHHGVDFSKGCYLGQELTARTHYRGLIKKRLAPVRALSGNCPPAGTLLMLDGKEVGEMRSSYDDIGLALVRVELGADAILSADGVNLTLVSGGA